MRSSNRVESTTNPCAAAPPNPKPRSLKIDVAGAGPTGLLLALTLVELMPGQVCIRIFDPRLRRENGHVVWRTAAWGNRRRQQIVTLQSRVWSNLTVSVREALFDEQTFTEVWPYGPDSPPERGRPRNLPISVIEDRLLLLARGRADIELIPERYQPEAVSGRDLLAICEGAQSQTREHFLDRLGRPHPDMYTLDGEPLQETVLGLQVETRISDGAAVLLTVAQNRFLMNLSRGRGFLNMRLSVEEASELVGIGSTGPIRCSQGSPCVMVKIGNNFGCPTHGTIFKPCVDPTSFLWPRVQDGLRLFDVEEEGLLAINAFRFTLVHRPRFVAEIHPGTWACLLGDAANAIHFWPGRGLNSGLKSALGLAGCLARRHHSASLREADLCAFEGLMHRLQIREIGNRAWRTMLMRDEHGVPRPIQERIARGLVGPTHRASLAEALLARMRDFRARLEGRMGTLPGDAELLGRLNAVSARTLKVLVETGPWIRAEVGGPEVEVDDLPL